MKILYFYQYFSTPKGSWGTRVYEFSKEWVKKGHNVTVVTSVYSKSDLKASKFIERQQIEGIHLIVLNIKIDNKQHPLRRVWTFIQYSLLSVYFAMVEKHDVVVASSGPITVGIPALLSKIIRRKKMVFEVRDLWPDTAIEMGYVNSRLLKKMMYAFEKFCYNMSDLIVTLSPGSAQNIVSRYKNYNTISVTNSANIDLFEHTDEKIVENFGLLDTSFAIYTGNIGEVNNSRLLLEAARRIKERSIEDLKIILVGDGQQKEELQEISEEQNLQDYFLMLDLMPKEKLVSLLKYSIASLIPLANKPLLNTSSPNKLFESLAAGVPVIQTTTGWIRELIETHDIGFTVSADEPDELVDALLTLKNKPELRSRLGKNAYRLAKSHFSKEVLADKMLDGIRSLSKE
jgi:glycosyltransferase involved in cell wall biosynthesis